MTAEGVSTMKTKTEVLGMLPSASHVYTVPLPFVPRAVTHSLVSQCFQSTPCEATAAVLQCTVS